MPFYSAFPPPAAAMKMIYGNFGAAALRLRVKSGFGQSRILKASASEKALEKPSLSAQKARKCGRSRRASPKRAGKADRLRCNSLRKYPLRPQCAAMKKLRISVSQFYHSKSHKSTFSDRFFHPPPTKSDLRIARGGAARKVMHGSSCRMKIPRT